MAYQSAYTGRQVDEAVGRVIGNNYISASNSATGAYSVINYPATSVTPTSINDLAWKGFSYKQIFEENNLVVELNFPDGETLPWLSSSTDASRVKYWYYGNTTVNPMEVTFQSNKSRSVIIMRNRYLNFNNGDSVYVATNVKQTGLSAGIFYLSINDSVGELDVPYGQLSSGYSIKSNVYKTNKKSTSQFSVGLNTQSVGSATYNNICVINMSSVFGDAIPKETMDKLYSNYVAMVTGVGLISTIDVPAWQDIVQIPNSADTRTLTTRDCVNKFMSFVNKKAQKIGMKSSYYITPSGIRLLSSNATISAEPTDEVIDGVEYTKVPYSGDGVLDHSLDGTIIKIGYRVCHVAYNVGGIIYITPKITHPSVGTSISISNVTTPHDLALLNASAAGYIDVVGAAGENTRTLNIVRKQNNMPLTIDNIVNIENIEGSSYSTSGNQIHVSMIKGGTWGTNGSIGGVFVGANGELMSTCCMYAPIKEDTYIGGKLIRKTIDLSDVAYSNNTVNTELVTNMDRTSIASYSIYMPNGNGYLYDGYNYKELQKHNSDYAWNAASTTKVLTAMVVSDVCPDWDNTYATIIQDDLVGYSGDIFFAGDTMSIRDMVCAMLMLSSNDLAHCLARTVGEMLLRSEYSSVHKNSAFA